MPPKQRDQIKPKAQLIRAMQKHSEDGKQVDGKDADSSAII